MKLKDRLIILFLAVSFIPTLIVSLLFYQFASKNTEDAVFSHLESVSKIQTTRIMEEINHNDTRINSLTSRTRIIELICKYNRKYRIPKTSDSLNVLLKMLLPDDSLIKGISILDTSGNVLATTAPYNFKSNYSKTPFFKRGLRKNINNFITKDERGNLMFYLCGPFLKNNKTIGLAFIKVSAQRFEKGIQDYTGLGKTGETLVAELNEKGNPVFLIPLRKDSSKIPFRTVDKNRDLPINAAFHFKRSMSYSGQDYKGDPILAWIQYLPETQWGLVSKIDKKEIYAPVRAQLMVIFALIGFICLGIIFLAIYISNRLTRPVFKLREIAEEILRDNYSIKKEEYGRDEFGIMGNAFNRMTEKLVRSKLDLEVRVEERTQELHFRNEELEKAKEELEKIIYVASHDLKTPLLGIMRLIEILELDFKDQISTELETTLKLVKIRSKRVYELINGILYYTSNTKSPKREKVNPEEVIKQIQQQYKDPSVSIKILFPLPIIVFDPSQIMEVFKNLIENGVEHNDNPLKKIEIDFEEEPSYWLFKISDNGRGIKERYFQKVFGLFQTLETDENKRVGVGLTLVKRIIELNGGNIWLSSSDQGTTVYFTVSKSV